MGVHPASASQDDEAGSELMRLAIKTDAWAIGEAGLDSTIRHVSMETQEKVFQYQVMLSWVVRLPLIIHERQAFSEVMATLTQYGMRSQKIHWHCFTGDYDKAERIMTYFPNVMFGATLKILNDAQLQDTFRKLPIQRVLLESDFPYIGKEPRSDLIRVGGCLAKLKEVTVLSVIKTCNNNFMKM